MSELFEPLRGALLSECGRYRFLLTRRWDERPVLLAVMFNPSHADDLKDDQTVSLVCQIAMAHGYGGVTVVNMCPLRSSTPGPAFAMIEAAQLEGADAAARAVMHENLEHIERALEAAGAVLVAWGALGHRGREWCTALLGAVREHCGDKPVFALGKCANGHPKHPMARGKHKVFKDDPLLPWSG